LKAATFQNVRKFLKVAVFLKVWRWLLKLQKVRGFLKVATFQKVRKFRKVARFQKVSGVLESSEKFQRSLWQLGRFLVQRYAHRRTDKEGAAK
jgi:hypothetical protein